MDNKLDNIFCKNPLDFWYAYAYSNSPPLCLKPQYVKGEGMNGVSRCVIATIATASHTPSMHENSLSLLDVRTLTAHCT